VTFRCLWVVGVLGLMTAGCTSSYVVVPAAGGSVAVASVAGISMAAHPESWNRDPEDLPEYVTPIWLNIVNQTSHTVRVRYADFALTDASGFRYAAISPYSGQPEVPSRPASSPAPNPAPSAVPGRPAAPASPNPPAEQPPSPTDSEPGSTTDAGLDVTPTWSGDPDHATGARIVLVSASRGGRGRAGIRAGGGFRGRGGFHRGFYGHPHYRAHVYVGPGPFFYDPWWSYRWGPYPYYWGVYYRGPYVYSWDYGYYPGAPTADILRFGLPEGELQPGGRVAGFIYFQHAVRRPGRLDLTWNVRDTDGRSIASVTAPMLVVQD
jgi:hypothetical protein